MKETHWDKFIAQIVHKEATAGIVVEALEQSTMPLPESIGIKWRWRDKMCGFWGVVRDREEALINVATTFYKAVRRQKREDHWYWRIFYRMVDYTHRLYSEALGEVPPNEDYEIPEAVELPQRF